MSTNKKPDSGQMTLSFGAAGSSTTKTSKPQSAGSRKEAASAVQPEEQSPEPVVVASPLKRAKTVKAATAETMAKQQRDISVSEFFAKNRHLLGFDNKRKALLMTIKEAVDNALDACEEAGHLPEIEVRIVQQAEDRFRIVVRDNGPGIVKQQIPNVFGKLLYGSKFHRLKMSRGQQGIGISAAGMYGLLTTGKSVKITSRTSPKKEAHYYEIQIDTKKNAPNIVKEEIVDVEWETGTQVEIELVASYNKGRQSVDEYIEQTAIANPHARVIYCPPVGERIVYDRGTEVMPAQTEAIRPHPLGVELGMLIKMLQDTNSHWLSAFLQTEFCRVGPKVAADICTKAKISPRSHPRKIVRQEAEKLYHAIQQTKLMSPPTNCLAPIGAEQILTGLLKGVKAEFFTASTRPPAVYRGNPFQIEVGLGYGGALGPDPKTDNNEEENGKGRNGRGKKNGGGGPAPARLIRFANRVPLLYQQSACCMFKTIVDLDWRRYGLSQSSGAIPQGPLVVMVHMASVWVPFTSESKEAIADYDEIRQEIRLALQECGRKLATYLNRRRRQKYEGDRRGVFERYIGEVVEACATITRIDRNELNEDLLKLARKITARADETLDEHGRPIAGPTAKLSSRDFGENTIVVDLDTEPAGELFQRSA
ncbi:MAG: DNA topoisomerase VI subunit B [Phycisphaerales bacterium]|nr:DNA topoisomerase VI subunit B [Phycisphaerales bacterium]